VSTISVDYDVLNQRGTPAWFSDVYANLPTAGFTGRMFVSTDTFEFYRDTGTAWVLIGGAGIGGITGSGVSGRATFYDGTSSITSSSNFLYNSASSLLTIAGSVAGTSLPLHIQNTNALGTGSKIVFSPNANFGSGDGAAVISSVTTAGGSDSSLTFGTYQSAVGPFERMRILGTNGYVGIGTTTPSYSLSIVGDAFVGLGLYNGTNQYISQWHSAGDFRFVLVQSAPFSFYTNNTEKVRISASGQFAIGTASPVALLDVSGGNASVFGPDTGVGTAGGGIYLSHYGPTRTNQTGSGIFALRDNGDSNFSGLEFKIHNTGTATDPAATAMQISSTGVAKIVNLAGTGTRAVLADSTGVLTAPVSDISVKENIQNIEYGLNEIVKMNPVWFNFIDEYKNYGEQRQNGNIAQDMEVIIPEAVFTTPSTGKKGINYDQLHAVYIKAIQELNEKLIRNNIN
jgi:hypothetical protein